MKELERITRTNRTYRLISSCWERLLSNMYTEIYINICKEGLILELVRIAFLLELYILYCNILGGEYCIGVVLLEKGQFCSSTFKNYALTYCFLLKLPSL